MNDEIKEILEQLEWYRKIGKKDVYYPECVLPNKKAFILLDYITNLQQERNMFKGSYETMSKNYFEEKSKNEKAIDKLSFIDEALESDTLNVPLCIAKINSALNILQNGSEKDE